MASTKKSSKRRQSTKKPAAVTPASIVAETEKTAEALASELKDAFDSLSHRVAKVTAAATKTTASVTERMATTEIPHLLAGLIEEVRGASETSLKTIGEGLEALREQVSAAGRRAVRAPARKRAVKKKVSASKKPAAKQATRKRVAAKKAATKAPTTKKKTAAKKKTAVSGARKKAANKRGGAT